MAVAISDREEPVDSTRELVGLFCSQARRRIDTLVHALWHNDDDGGYATAWRSSMAATPGSRRA